MKMHNNKILVKFDENHNKTVSKGLNGLDIVRPDRWYNNDGTEDSNKEKYNENTNFLETHSQICTVIAPSTKHHYKIGDVLFVHYMAKETCEAIDLNGVTGDVIDTYFILFQIVDGEFKMVDGMYLGEQQYTEEEVRPSGIILSEKKEGLRVKITHVPDNSVLNVGDIVTTIDDKQYELNYWGKKYIKLVEHEIVGVLI